MSPNDDNDPQLRALFERDDATILDEPFVSDTIRRIATARRRRSMTTRAVQAAALIAVVGLSPWLIAGSVLLSAKLDALFSYTAELLGTPTGTVLAGLGVLAVVVLNRKRIF